jgi:hypothetical protein
MIPLRGILEYGIVAKDMRALDFTRSAYEYIRALGIPQIGYICTMNGNTMESCGLGDVLSLAIKMSDAGMGDYWDDVDCIARNSLVEAQLIHRDLLERIVKHSPQPADPGTPTNANYDHVIDRVLGSYGSYSQPHRIDPTNVYTCGCCNGNATQGLYYAWEGITRCERDHATVNLLLNRASPWLDIDSYLPYEGKVVLKIKTAKRLSVRIPSWVDRSQLTCTVDGTARPHDWLGAYVLMNDLKENDVVEMNFPMKEWVFQRSARISADQAVQFTIQMRGNTVVDISPRDDDPRSYPLYQRDELKTGRKAPMKKVVRYVSEVVPQP